MRKLPSIAMKPRIKWSHSGTAVGLSLVSEVPRPQEVWMACPCLFLKHTRVWWVPSRQTQVSVPAQCAAKAGKKGCVFCT